MTPATGADPPRGSARDPSGGRPCASVMVISPGPPGAGGTLPLPPLPPFRKAIGPAPPPGAGTWAPRSIACSTGSDMTASPPVLPAWAAAGTAVTLPAATLRTRRAQSTP
ncbi:hypothetical protein [Streptomyces sp. NPDC057690]|uniref:hypothetical protein n=1 Tax=Streptomyces sp. NPDC057690 TaxID=3346214 RepID=UPI00369E8607